MNFLQIVVYLLQFTIIGGLMLWYFQKKFKWSKYLIPLFLLLLSSCFIAGVSAFLSVNGYEFDSQKFFQDSQVINDFIRENPFKNIWILFLSGDNSLYPSSYYDTLETINTWTRTSNYMMTRLFSIFSFLSFENIYSISLFFGLMAFAGKCLLLRIVQLEKVQKLFVILFYVFLLIGGSEMLFSSGVYKESVAFVCISLLIYLLYVRKVRNLLFAFTLLILSLVRVEFVLVWIGLWLFTKILSVFKQSRLKGVIMIVGLLAMCYLFIEYFGGGIEKYVDRYWEYKIHRGGNTDFQYKSIPAGFLLNEIINFISVFIRPMALFVKSYKAIHFFQECYNAILVIYLVVLFICVKIKGRANDVFKYTLLTSFVMLIVLSITIFNFGALVRYRSIYVILLVFVLTIYQQKHIAKKNI